MYSILICDDDRDIVNALKIYLSEDSYQLIEAFNGQEALQIIKKQDIHLVLMDIMMPVMDGMEAMAEIRRFSNVPIILLTAKSEDIDIISGLEVGADDYITKPFSPMEVKARVHSQLRRYLLLGSGQVAPTRITIGPIELDIKARTVYLDGVPIYFTPTEYEILKLLMQNPGQVFSPKDIYKAIWRSTPLTSDNTIAVHIRHIREKIEINPADPRYLKAVWGRGYMIEKITEDAKQ